MPSPAHAEQNCNIMTWQEELLQDLSAPVKIQVKQYTTNKQTIQHQIVTTKTLC